jgi:hypothetical protein
MCSDFKCETGKLTAILVSRERYVFITIATSNIYVHGFSGLRRNRNGYSHVSNKGRRQRMIFFATVASFLSRLERNVENTFFNIFIIIFFFYHR